MPAELGFTIEEKIRPLVNALNNLEYISTISSCEGHFNLSSEDERSRSANVIFQAHKGHYQKLEGLILEILKETSKDGLNIITDIYYRYVKLPERKELGGCWAIEFIPSHYKQECRDLKRKVVDEEISRVVKIVKDYAKNQPQ